MYYILEKQFRKRKRMTQEDVAKKSGISESYLSHLEKEGVSRDRTPTLQTLENLSIALNICVRDIGFYPCIECPMNKTCTKKDKDMRPVDVIADEIISHYMYKLG